MKPYDKYLVELESDYRFYSRCKRVLQGKRKLIKVIDELLDKIEHQYRARKVLNEKMDRMIRTDL